VKYTEEGSITLRVRPDTDEVQIAIIDTGIGIAPEHHEAIFKEFRQVNESPARKREGTGLGLPITRHLIERHGGRMWVESEPGKGSTFVIALPIAEVEVIANELPVVQSNGIFPETANKETADKSAPTLTKSAFAD